VPVTLPDNPSLDRLRRQSRDLQRAVRAGDPAALALVTEHHPAGLPADPGRFPLTAAQHVVARRCGFTSWPRLKHYLDVAAPIRRTMPVTEAAAGGRPDEPGERINKAHRRSDGAGRQPDQFGGHADEFWALACLLYSPLDEPDGWQRAAAILRDHPHIPAASVWAASAAADAAAVRAHLEADPALANAEGGPHRWPPLMYLAYSRLGCTDSADRGRQAGPTDSEPEVARAEDDALECARLLLDAGADPNAGYLWRGMPTPFTVLTGVFGGGEQGIARQPSHQQAPALARLLLDRGADPNDGQTLYNRMFIPEDDHLRLLLQYGLGSGDGGTWRRRLGDVLDSPAELLVQQLAWAIDHRFTGRVRLLLRHGVDVRRPLPSWPCSDLAGLSPVAAAWRSGGAEIARLLVDAGADPVAPTGVQRVMAELLAGRAPATHDAARTHDAAADIDAPSVHDANDEPYALDAVADLRARHPDLIHRADTPAAVRALVGAGFAVNARRDGATALHWAAWRGRRDLVRALLRAGADPGITDAQHGATPLGWAEHARQVQTVALLRDAERR
jgi:hypothetical protein